MKHERININRVCDELNYSFVCVWMRFSVWYINETCWYVCVDWISDKTPAAYELNVFCHSSDERNAVRAFRLDRNQRKRFEKKNAMLKFGGIFLLWLKTSVYNVSRIACFLSLPMSLNYLLTFVHSLFFFFFFFVVVFIIICADFLYFDFNNLNDFQKCSSIQANSIWVIDCFFFHFVLFFSQFKYI